MRYQPIERKLDNKPDQRKKNLKDIFLKKNNLCYKYNNIEYSRAVENLNQNKTKQKHLLNLLMTSEN